MRSLVWRYVSAMHRRYEESAVTEDDINEVKADISSMRYEILAIFEKNGMDISSADKKERAHLAKRMKVWERRLMKDFHVAPVTGEDEREDPPDKGIVRFRRVAKQIVSQTTSFKWTEAVQGVTNTQIGRCRNRESFKHQQNLQRAMNEAKRFERGMFDYKANLMNISYLIYRFVEKSPSFSSRPESPIEYYDPNREELLLNNMFAGTCTPSHSISRTPVLNSRQVSPVATVSQSSMNLLPPNSGTRKKGISSPAKPGPIEDLNNGNKHFIQNIPQIEITKTDSQILSKKTYGSKESLDSMTSNDSGSPVNFGMCITHQNI